MENLAPHQFPVGYPFFHGGCFSLFVFDEVVLDGEYFQSLFEAFFSFGEASCFACEAGYAFA